MLLSDAIIEVCARAGLGFEQHATRARILFWKALSTLIKSGAVEKDDIRTIYQSSVVYVDANGTQPVTLDLNSASGFSTILSTYLVFQSSFYVFDKALPSTTAAAKIFCTKLTENQFENAEQLLPLSLLNKEVLYCIKYPTLKILKNTLITATANVNVEMRFYGVLKTVSETDATELDTYLNADLQNKTMEAAAELLKTEIIN
jgi:hypothetical protein